MVAPPPPTKPVSPMEALDQIVPDLDEKEYIAEMIKEENPTDFDTLWDLLADFLESSEEYGGTAKQNCKDILLLIHPPSSTNITTTTKNKNLQQGGSSPSAGGAAQNTKANNAPKLLGEMLQTGHENAVGFQDAFMGLGEKKANYNEVVAISDLVKERRTQNTKEKAAVMHRMQQWMKSKLKPPAPQRLHRTGNAIGKVTDLIIDKFGVTIGGKELIEDTTLKVVIGRKYGLHGRNGTGKTCLLATLAKKDHPKIPKHVHIVTVEQEIDHLATSDSALWHVLAVDTERCDLEAKIRKLEELGDKIGDKDANLLVEYQERWAEIDGDAAPHIAGRILSGLGFDEARQHQGTSNLSGGWRARVALARALFAEPDILLLDEPTNHLDVHAVAWLEDFLKDYPQTIIMVSHARDTLNEVCTDITHLQFQKLFFYRGDFDTFETLYAQNKKLLEKQHEKNEREAAHMQQFIDKFRCNAKRASMVQSRIKALNRLPLLDEILEDPSLSFMFGEPEPVPTPILQMDEACFQYESAESQVSKKPFHLNNINLNIDLESRIVLVGENGCGKSTLLKMLIGDHEPKAGIVRRHNRLRIGYFTQHHVESMDLTLNSIQNLMERYPKAMNEGEEAARNWLGRFGVMQSLAVEPLYVLSGGQKSRVALALLAYANPHILVMDEPTNHLDLDAIQALIAALTAFKGGLVMVSHDSHFINAVCDEIWHVHDNTATKFDGDIHEFRKFVLAEKKKQGQ
ncbi:unnamed protein product [Amoebophrya sp. A120]|nr:unnamed protein product [Amoebophrya sp. A120]|eukprot:GSA120T00008434001.1